MRNDQKKFLKDKLEESYRLQQASLPGGRWQSTDSLERPAAVAKAEKELEKNERIVARWKKAEKRKMGRAKEQLKARYMRAKTALLFHDPDKALAAVNKFTAPTDSSNESQS